MNITPEETVSPEAYADALEIIKGLEEDVASQARRIERLVKACDHKQDQRDREFLQGMHAHGQVRALSHECEQATGQMMRLIRERDEARAMRDALNEETEILTARIGGAEREAEAHLEMAMRLEKERDQARGELLALRHRDLLGRATTGALPNGLHLNRWAELVCVGWVAWSDGLYVLTAKGEEVWRG